MTGTDQRKQNIASFHSVRGTITVEVRSTMNARNFVVLAVAALFFSAACSTNNQSFTGAPAGLARHAAVRHASGSGPQGKITNVVVIIQENRSFEDFFAGYPGANAPTYGCGASPPPSGSERPIENEPLHPLTSASCPPGDQQIPLRKVTFKSNPDLRYDWHSSMVDWNNGRMDGWTAWPEKNGYYMGYTYVDQTDVQPYWTMAQQYVLADAMFPTEFGGGFTGHLTLVAGTDDIKLPGRAEVNSPNAFPEDCDSPSGTVSSYVGEKPYRKLHFNQGPFPCFDQFNTMAQVLDNASIPWKMYATKVMDAGFSEPFEAIKYVRFGNDWKTDIIAPQTKVLKDAAAGNLAAVSWVTPSGLDSDHPAYHSDKGPSWVTSVVNAVGQSSYWPSSAIIVVWDGWGGEYDNAAPPQLDYRGLGIRIPCLIISPYAKQGYVSHVQYEYGSILRFIEEVYGLPAGSVGPTSQGYTDGRANSLDDAFNFSQSPRSFTKIKSKYSM